MEKKEINTRTKLLRIAIAVAIVFIAFSIGRAIMILNTNPRIGADDLKSIERAESTVDVLSEGWTLINEGENAKRVTLPQTIKVDEGKQVVLLNKIQDPGKHYNALKIDNNRYGVEVYFDGSLIYRSNTGKMADQLIYLDPCLVRLPAKSGEVALTIVFSEGPNGEYNIPQISTGALGEFKYGILNDNIFTLIIISFFWALILTLLITGIIYRKVDYKEPRIIALIAFLFFTSNWGMYDSFIPELFDMPIEMSGLLCYLSFMAMSIPIAYFIQVTLDKHSKLLDWVIALGFANIFVQVIVSLFGLVRLNQMIWLSSVVIAITIISSVVEIVRCYSRGAQTREIKMIFTGGYILALMGIVALFLYWTKLSQNYRDIFLLGVLIFMIFFFISIVIRYSEEKNAELKLLREAELTKRVSMYDQLTGLLNRRAFDMKMEEIKENPKQNDAVLLMMDLNGLKVTNDSYGHNAGDELIVAGARAIEKNYGNDGTCYRIGGDEFAVVLDKPRYSILTYDKKLEELIEEYNKEVKWTLSIARGASNLINIDGERKTVSDWKMDADIKMYRDKQARSVGMRTNVVKGLQEIINCVIATLEARDEFTRSHSERVREISVYIAKKLGLSDATVAEIETAAYLHDIGKIGVPDSILKKPGKLTKEEYEIMAEHPVIGAEIIGKATDLRETADVILHHHERYDGSGYPDRLKEHNIPLQSRIIAVADSIDAMTSKRAYRERMSLNDCRDQIEQCAGTTFDPLIAQLVLENWKDIEDIVLLHPKRLGSVEIGGSIQAEESKEE